MKHLHILGICGTFMGGLALLARAAGYRVTGSDEQVYPPMSTLLESQGIVIWPGHEAAYLQPPPDTVVVGNVMRRGHPAVEQVLNQGLRYTSGPQWLYEHILADRWVLAVAGTHGKTTTASLLAWILEYAGLEPGFLIGGVPENFGVSARLGNSPFFVIEADEYDTAFFDKRSKCVHYRPRTLILNNLEYDHADIFPDLAAIEQQFHHLVRTVPGAGLIVCNRDSDALARVLAKGCWTPVKYFSQDQDKTASEGFAAHLQQADGQQFALSIDGTPSGECQWSQYGRHNVANALAALAAAQHVGVPVAVALEALAQFRGVKRRMEVRGCVAGVTVYDDFAHHPTAIALTLQALRARVGPTARIIAILEPRSNTMRMGIHQESLANSLAEADRVLIYTPPGLGWDITPVIQRLGDKAQAKEDLNALVEHLLTLTQPGDHCLIMSNGGFGGVHQTLLTALAQRAAG